MPGINMMPSGSTLQIPLDACTNFSGKAGNAQVTLTWTDPKDKYATPEGETAQDPDQLVSVWEYTQIIRKTGSQPAGPHDGELVVSSSVRDQYATTGFVDTGLVNGTLYYYAAYAYNTDGVASAGVFVNATPMAGTPLTQLAEGTLIKILENGSPVQIYLAKHSYEPSLNAEGRELVVRKDGYDSREWNTSFSLAYASCALDSWLNSTYYNLLSAYAKTQIVPTIIQYTPEQKGSISTLSRKVFTLSLTELGRSVDWANVEGSTLPIAPVLQIAHDSFNVNVDQWTRSIYNATNQAYAGYVDAYGGAHYIRVTVDKFSRPCFTLPATALVDQDLNLIET